MWTISLFEPLDYLNRWFVYCSEGWTRHKFDWADNWRILHQFATDSPYNTLLVLNLVFFLQLYIYIYMFRHTETLTHTSIYTKIFYHDPHQIILTAQSSMMISCHLSLSSITPSRFSWLYQVSAQRWCKSFLVVHHWCVHV